MKGEDLILTPYGEMIMQPPYLRSGINTCFLIGLRGKRENRSFLECRILIFVQNISVYAVQGKTVRHSVKKNTSFYLLLWSDAFYQSNSVLGKTITEMTFWFYDQT